MGVVGEVAPPDDEVVPAGEEAQRHPHPVGLAHGLPLVRRRTRGAQLGAQYPHDVLASGGLGQVGLHALTGDVRDLEAVVGVPVVVGQDLEEVGDPPELRHRVRQLRGRQRVETLPGAVRPPYHA